MVFYQQRHFLMPDYLIYTTIKLDNASKIIQVFTKKHLTFFIIIVIIYESHGEVAELVEGAALEML